MSGMGGHNKRAAWCYLALAALCFRALVPDGFMLDRSEQSWPAIVPCPARSPELVELLAQLGHEHHHGHHHGDDGGAPSYEASAGAQCPFAVAVFGVTPPTHAFAPPSYPPQPAAVVLSTGIARLPATRTPPSTGPPAVLS